MPDQTQSLSGKLPIYIIGAGSIVNVAHLPAYAIAGFNVQGIFDVDHEKAISTAVKFSIPIVFKSMAELIAQLPANSIVDVAVPGDATIAILEQLPPGSNVL